MHERDYIAGAICDIEMVSMVRVLSNDGVDMNSVHDSYISLRNEHGVHTIPGRNNKPDVKNILLENIPDINFVKRGGQNQILCCHRGAQIWSSKSTVTK